MPHFIILTVAVVEKNFVLAVQAILLLAGLESRYLADGLIINHGSGECFKTPVM